MNQCINEWSNESMNESMNHRNIESKNEWINDSSSPKWAFRSHGGTCGGHKQEIPQSYKWLFYRITDWLYKPQWWRGHPRANICIRCEVASVAIFPSIDIKDFWFSFTRSRIAEIKYEMSQPVSRIWNGSSLILLSTLFVNVQNYKARHIKY